MVLYVGLYIGPIFLINVTPYLGSIEKLYILDVARYSIGVPLFVYDYALHIDA